MKYHEPRFIALINAWVISVAASILFVLGILLFDPGVLKKFSTILILLLSGLLIFLISYNIFQYTLERFIYSKIRLIYKTIHNIKARKDAPYRTPRDKNILEKVSKEVEVWQEEKRKEIEQLKQLEAYRRDFIGNTAHELKTPLFNIQGYVLTLLDGGIHDPTINMEYLRRTEKSVERMIHIIEDLDEIAQLESGQIRLKITRFDLVALVKDVLETLEQKAFAENIQILFNKNEKPVMVEGDREKIRQVVTNIVDNSIRYGSDKEGKTKISFFDMGDNILTEITDNGLGIDAEDPARVFERFYRTPQGRSHSKEGKGLGLAIVKHIIEAHKQAINVRSTVGIGTTFGFTLKKAP
jgi:two-component system phosphate regulon sensor histidine kinase PhoR